LQHFYRNFLGDRESAILLLFMDRGDFNNLDLKTLQAHSSYRFFAPSMSADPESELHYLRCQLLYEQTRHYLDVELNDYVLSFLSDTDPTCLEANIYAEDVVFQALVHTLSRGLGEIPVAIAIPQQSHPAADLAYTLQHFAAFTDAPKQQFFNPEPIANQEGLRPAPWKISYQKMITLTPGQSLTQQELSTLQAQFPNDIRPVVQHPSGIIWLLLDRVGADLSPYVELEEQWIEDILARCVIALEQIRHIQNQRQQKQVLLHRNRELEQMNQLKSEFLANTSHEIRTPLSSILGFTHLLQQQSYNPINLRHQEYLKIILSSGQHLLALMNDILDLSKIEANQLSLELETVDVGKVCEVALMLIREKAIDRGLGIQLEIDPAVSTVVVDSLRLKQMLFNLLSNAVKFTLRGAIGLQVSLIDDHLHFSVWDTGTGISKEQQAQLFKPYSQISNSAVTRGEGTGLGLVLTQKLAELHGGWIEIISALNQGSRFTIVLPMEARTASPSSSTEPRPLSEPSTEDTSPVHPPVSPSSNEDLPPTSSPLTSASSTKGDLIHDPLRAQPSNPEASQSDAILLVEDNLHNAKLVLTYLSRLGCRLHWAKDGSELWQLLNGAAENPLKALPAMILMDVNLPDVDGLTLTRQLKANPVYAGIPVIAQTAMAMKGDRDVCLNSGADGYLSKPIDLNELTQLVSQYVTIKPKD
jgi:signal transduction histidine kinase/ActR/RegA family two-component response regulator